MLKSFVKYALVIVLSVFYFHCGPDAETVATVGSLKVTKDELRSDLKRRYPKQADLNAIDAAKKKEVLDKIILKKLKINAAYDMGLDQDPDLLNQLQAREQNMLGNKYYERVIVDKLISPQEIDEYLEKQGTEIKAHHILIGYKDANRSVKRTKEEARKLAEELAKKAKGGADFEQLAVQYSDEPGAKNKKGDLGYFTWGRMVPPFQEAAWALKVGEISDPVETRYGFHIIRLDDRRDVEGYTPSRTPETILNVKRSLFKTYADTARKLWQAHSDEMKKNSNYRVNKEAINELATLLTEKIEKEKVTADSFTPETKNKKLIEWDGGSITLQTLLDKYSNRLARALGSFRQADVLKRECENQAIMLMVTAGAKEMGLDKEEDVLKTLNKFKEDRLAQLAEKKNVMSEIKMEDEDIRKYYDENPGQFKKPAEIEIWEVFVKNEKQAKKVLKMARAGRKFSDLARKYSEDKYYSKKGGYLGFRTQTARGTVSRKAFEIGPNSKPTGPIKYRNGWAVIKTGEKHEETQRPFKEAIAMVKSRLRNKLIREKRTAWEKELREKYSIEINETALNAL